MTGHWPRASFSISRCVAVCAAVHARFSTADVLLPRVRTAMHVPGVITRDGVSMAACAQVLESLSAMIAAAAPSPHRVRAHPAARVVRMHRFGGGPAVELGDAAGEAPAGDGGAAAAGHDARGAVVPQARARDRRVVVRGLRRELAAGAPGARSGRRGAEVAARVVRAGRYRGAGEQGHLERDVDVDVREGHGLAREGVFQASAGDQGPRLVVVL